MNKTALVALLSFLSSGIAFGEDAYLESTGTQCINTGYFVNAKTKIEIDFQLTEVVSQSRLFGQNGSSCGNYAVVYMGDTANNFKFGYGNSFNGVYIAPNNLVRNTIVYDGPNDVGYLYQDGVLKTRVALTAAHDKTAAFPLAIFGESTNSWGNKFQNFAKMRLYGFKIFEGDELVREYVPCVEAGIAGLYEKFEGRFLSDPRQSHTADNEFAYGGDIMVKEDDGYITSAGGVRDVINTRFFACPGMRVDLDLRLSPTPNKDKRFLGADYVASGDPGFAFYMSGKTNLSFCAFAGGQGSTSGAYAGPGYVADTLRHTMSYDMLYAEGGTVKPRTWFSTWGTTNYYNDKGANFRVDKVAQRPIGLFGNFKDAIPNATDNTCGFVKVYRLRCWKDGELVHDYVPRKVDGIAGLRDLVDGEFVTAENITAGGAIVEEKGDAYVESKDRARYFDTGYMLGPKTRIEADFAFMDRVQQQFLFESGTEVVCRLYHSGSDTYSWACQDDAGNWTSTGLAVSKNVRRKILIDAKNRKVSLSTANFTNYTAVIADAVPITKTCTKSVKIFCNSTANGNTTWTRLYGFKIYDDDRLIHDYEPISEGGEGVLLDRVTGQILLRGNNNACQAGGNIRQLGTMLDGQFRDEDAYVESDGTQSIKLDYHTKSTTRYEIDYQLTKIKGQDRPFGAAGGTTTGGLSAELYIQGTADGSGNVAVGVGDSWAGHSTSKGADLNRHGAVLDCSGLVWGYTGYGTARITSTCKGTGKFPMVIFGKSTNTEGSTTNRAKMKLYAFRIYESEELVHQYLPYKVGSTIGLYDTVTKTVLTKSESGVNELVYGGGCGYGKYTGAPASFVTVPQGAEIAAGETTVLSAYAPGAVKYVWTKDGEVIADETTETLTVAWEKKKSPRQSVYAVKPVFLIDGVETEGAPAEATVTYRPLGSVISIR